MLVVLHSFAVFLFPHGYLQVACSRKSPGSRIMDMMLNVPMLRRALVSAKLDLKSSAKSCSCPAVTYR